MAYRFLRMPGLRGRLGNPSKSLVYNRVRDELLPPPIKDGCMSIWPEDEIEAVQDYIIAGRTDDEIRSLVRRLVARRADRARRVAA